MRRAIVGIVAGLARIAAVVALSAGAALAQSDNAPIRIGAFLSLTGPAAYLGDPQDKTLRLGVAEINAQGGLLGRQVQLFVYDDGGDAEKARTFGRRLVDEDKVDILIGGTLTGTSMAVAPLAEEAQVPLMALGGAVVIIEPVHKWVFKTSHTDQMACVKIFEDLAKRGLTRIAFLSGTEAFGKSMRAQCVKVAPRYSVQILADQTYGAEDTDLSGQFAKIEGTPLLQALVDAGFGQGAVTVLRTYRQLGMTWPFYESLGAASEQFVTLVGAAAEGVRLPGAPLLIADLLPDDDPQKPVLLDYRQRFMKRWGQPASPFGGYARDALAIVADAINRAGAVDRAKIRDEIEKTRGFVDTAGTVNMSPSDHLGLNSSAFRLLEIRNGAWTLVK